MTVISIIQASEELNYTPPWPEQVEKPSVVKPHVHDWPCRADFMFIMLHSQLFGNVKGTFIESSNAGNRSEWQIRSGFMA